jgi:hypothetical protein
VTRQTGDQNNAPRAVDIFEAVCRALDVPVGAERLDTFLQLPREQRVEILRELTAEEAKLAAGRNGSP